MSILGKCVVITISILLVDGFPAREETKSMSTDENCLKINPEIQKQIDSIVEQITNNINTIAANYDDIDLRLLEISMDRHYSEEGEKNTVVQIIINDCTKGVSQTKYNADQKHKHNPVVQDKNEYEAELQKYNDKDDDDDDILNDSKSEKLIAYEKSDKPSQANNADQKHKNNPVAQGKNENKAELHKYDDENVNSDYLEDDDDDDILNYSKSEELIANEKSDEPSLLFPEENDITEDDIFIDDVINNSNEILKYKNDDEKLFVDYNEESNINKDNVPDVLEFINYNDIKTALFNDEINNDSNESLVLNDNDKIFFRAMTRARGTGPFAVYQRRYDDAEEYWFF